MPGKPDKKAHYVTRMRKTSKILIPVTLEKLYFRPETRCKTYQQYIKENPWRSRFFQTILHRLPPVFWAFSTSRMLEI